ncbi:hypothetical protein B0T19DRAFT_472779 [Cercophora scortea]|uniref:Uncharacterized protein n=1 Tax=Cercophora scortea TaxID=314031 RepID=A0AAE0IUU7_9PEZI|nr:hypothetical protein B0T19DRAFT_472779 [Cercophora scortea]
MALRQAYEAADKDLRAAINDCFGLRAKHDGPFLHRIRISYSVVMAITNNRGDTLDWKLATEKFVPLLKACHAERGLLLWSCREQLLFWQKVRSHLPWAIRDDRVDNFVLSEIALAITQAAWLHHKHLDTTKTGQTGIKTELAAAACTFAADLIMYEGHMRGRQDDGDLFSGFTAWRAPAQPIGGRNVVPKDENGDPKTVSVFPITMRRPVHTPTTYPVEIEFLEDHLSAKIRARYGWGITNLFDLTAQEDLTDWLLDYMRDHL